MRSGTVWRGTCGMVCSSLTPAQSGRPLPEKALRVVNKACVCPKGPCRELVLPGTRLLAPPPPGPASLPPPRRPSSLGTWLLATFAVLPSCGEALHSGQHRGAVCRPVASVCPVPSDHCRDSVPGGKWPEEVLQDQLTASRGACPEGHRSSVDSPPAVGPAAGPTAPCGRRACHRLTRPLTALPSADHWGTADPGPKSRRWS